MTSSPRTDGRQPNQLRPISIERGFTKNAPGSVLMSYGDTKVLVTATIEDRVPRHIYISTNDNEGWLTAEYALLPGSTNTRSQRDRLKISGRTAEIQRLIGRSLRAAVDLKNIGQRTITIDADVLQADGGTRVACITAGYVALIDALLFLKRNNKLKTVPAIQPVAAVSVGMVNGQAVLDLNYEEDMAADVDANVVMNSDGKFIEFQATCEDEPFSYDDMLAMTDLAREGLSQLHEYQNQALGNAMAELHAVHA